MQDFEVNGDNKPESVAFDATDRHGSIVTVGVCLNRSQEATLLDDLYNQLKSCDYRPFETKSRDLELPPGVVAALISQYDDHIGVCVHPDAAPKLPYAEATHSAILLERLITTVYGTVGIVDGDESRAEQLVYATEGLGFEPPPVANCVQGERYYPHILLADLIAGEVADALADGALSAGSITCGSLEPVINTLSGSESDQWERAYDAVARGNSEHEYPTVEQRYAESTQSRIVCWFRGQMGKKHAPGPATSSTQPVARRLEAMGNDTVAEWIEEQ